MAKKAPKTVEAIRHAGDTRKNIPTAEHQSVLEKEQQAPREVRYPRNTDLDPQLMWRGKDYQDWSDLVVQAPPLYIQEKIHPKTLVDDLARQSKDARAQDPGAQIDLFADFNGLPKEVDRTEFYQHDQNWTNRMILGDSLQVMASLAEREGLRGKVQCIYFDPPYGIRFNSNFQWSTTNRDVKEKSEHITREPEQVKAFRDTWRDGLHSYLTYMRDRLSVARDLLCDSGSLFVQIGGENVHRVRTLMDEVFGERNFIEMISYRTKNMTLGGRFLEGVCDTILWYAKNIDELKYRKLFSATEAEADTHWNQILCSDGTHRRLTSAEIQDHSMLPEGARLYQLAALYPAGSFATGIYSYGFRGKAFDPPTGRSWKSPVTGMRRLEWADRIEAYSSGETIRYRLVFEDYPVSPIHNVWLDTAPAADKQYVVQTGPRAVERCLLMASDPGDLVIDPTCGSGTTAYVAEQWGRRWITIDTSRVALALARARIMGARYPYYLLADSPEGQRKEAEVSGRAYVEKPAFGNVRHGFVYERVPHITLKSIANNAEIDVIWEQWQPTVQDALARLNASLRGHKKPYRVTSGGREGTDVRFDAKNDATFTMPSGEVVPAFALVEWEVPRDAPGDWPDATRRPLAEFWDARIARQKAIDGSIAAKAEFEYLYDRPYRDDKKVRVAGPFTVESLSPHRMLGVDEDDELIDPMMVREAGPAYGQTFEQMILENLKVAGVQQAHKEDRIVFSTLAPWPGELVCAEGRYRDSAITLGAGPSTTPDVRDDAERRAAIFIGPEFGTVSRPDLVAAAREAGDAGFDVLVACAFNYDAHATEFSKLGRIPVLKARMNADLHMGGDLKATKSGNLFVIFGEPDISVLDDGDDMIRVKVNGVDVFDPGTGEVRSEGADGIASWFIDTDYNEESFFVRHAYFLGQNDPYGALKTTLKAEIDADAWSTLHSDTSRPFERPTSGRIAVKVINHLGDEVMKVFRVQR